MKRERPAHRNPSGWELGHLFDLLVLPIAFGLVGFLEPCSIAANLTLLSYVEKDLPGGGPVTEALKFTLARSLFLGLVGAGVGLLGARLFWVQSAYIMGIGLLFILLGLFDLAAHRFGWQLPALDLSRWLRYRQGKSWAAWPLDLSVLDCSGWLFRPRCWRSSGGPLAESG